MTSSPTAPVQLSRRPKRADALRNYEKLLAAARGAFTEAGRSASLEDIARRAVFVIDRNGVVRHREVLEDARNEPDYGKISQALAAL